MELGRYFNSKDEPILLSKDHNHARLVLTQRRKNLKKRNITKQADKRDNTFLQIKEVEDSLLQEGET